MNDSDLKCDIPFGGENKTKKPSNVKLLTNEEDIIKQLAKENNFVSAPKIRKAEIRKQIFLYEEDEKILIDLQRYGQDREGLKISQGEIIRSAIRMFAMMPLEEQSDLVKNHKEEEGL